MRTGKIPNWLTLPAIIAGLVAHGVLDGGHGLVSATCGGVIMLSCLLPFVLMRGVGMGDLKLLIATGISAGIEKCFWILLFAVFINAVFAIILAVRKRCLGSAIANTFTIMHFAIVRPFRPHPELNLDNKSVYRFPFGVAVGIGCIVTAIRAGVIG